MIDGLNKAGVDWLLTKAWLLVRRDGLLAGVLSPQQDHGTTQYMRGMISMIDELIAEAEPTSTPEAEDQKDYV